MQHSERLAVAAHVHVLLRRKTGRVTDTEWMAGNAEYAREIVRFCRLRAREEGLEELGDWADKLERATQAEAGRAVQRPVASQEVGTPDLPGRDGGGGRYVGGIR